MATLLAASQSQTPGAIRITRGAEERYATAWRYASSDIELTHDVAEPKRMIRRDEADIMFTGGSEAAVTELSVAAFGAMHALSTR